MQSVNKVMSFLESGQWFGFEDLTSKCSLPECKVGSVLDFLTQFDFLQKDKDKQIFRLHPELISLFNRLKEMNHNENSNI